MKAIVKVNVVMQGELLAHPASFQVAGEFEMGGVGEVDTNGAAELERQALSLKHAIEEAFHRLSIKPPSLTVVLQPVGV